MELIKISSTKLKIMLSADDMKDLDFDPVAREDISCRTGFRNILLEARDRCGFDAVGERVFVQYYPEKHGGCEMFVTKLAERSSEHCRQVQKNHRRDSAFAKREGNRYIVYEYGELSSLMHTCGRLYRTGYLGKSAVYKDFFGSGSYYLILERQVIFACEDGGHEINGKYRHYLSEHGKLICENAVDKLGRIS